MFLKRFLNKIFTSQDKMPLCCISPDNFCPRITVHYGIPFTSSVIAFDPIQRLLAIGTLDGRIKVIGGDNIEGLLVSPRQLPYKYLEFLCNQGALVAISNENDIQVWDLIERRMACTLKWNSNITSFSVINATRIMYIGDEYGLLAVIKYDHDKGVVVPFPYQVSACLVEEAADISLPSNLPIVGVLPQPHALGNRVLIAYANGLLILWDVSDARPVVIRGHGARKRKEVNLSDFNTESMNEDSIIHHDEKEICSLCWASASGSVLAVGYIDGDILLWDISTTSSINCPVDVDMASKAIKVLNAQWSSGLETVKSLTRVNIKLDGPFADMILLPYFGPKRSSNFALFILTNPGQLHVCDSKWLSAALLSKQEDMQPVHLEQFPSVVPISDPCMTLLKLVTLSTNCSRLLSELGSLVVASASPVLQAKRKWCLTGGFTSALLSDVGIKRLFVGAYQYGSLCIWDATTSIFSPLFVLIMQFPDVNFGIKVAPISSLDICSNTLSIAIGDENGLVYVYKLSENPGTTEFHYFDETHHSVHAIHHEKGFCGLAALVVRSSPVRALNFTEATEKLVIGFECSEVVLLDLHMFSVLFLIDSSVELSSPIITLMPWACKSIDGHMGCKTDAQAFHDDEAAHRLLFILTSDTHIVVVDSISGHITHDQHLPYERDSTAVSLHVIGTPLDDDVSFDGANEQGTERHMEKSSTPYLLICFCNAVHLYTLESIMQGDCHLIHRVDLAIACCWSSVFKISDREVLGLVLLCQSGNLEIRGLPDLEVVMEVSLVSILRWDFGDDTCKVKAAQDNGQMVLVRGSELALISLLAAENCFRIPNSLPCLHNDTLADDSKFFLCQHKNQNTHTGILGAIVKGLKGKNVDSSVDFISDMVQNLENIFSDYSMPGSGAAIKNDSDGDDISIDDVVIDDEPVCSSSHDVRSSSHDVGARKSVSMEAVNKLKPRLRTPQEIKAQYGRNMDISVISDTKEKLAQRQEKLQRIGKHAEELQSGAESFASMASELAKKMESRKWWP